jgi:hypothetical protein
MEPHMDRGIKAYLSPNEEVTLRRLSYGIAKPEEFRPEDLLQLAKLGLIAHLGDKLVLTPSGTDRLARLRGIDPASSRNDWLTRMVDALRSSKGGGRV